MRIQSDRVAGGLRASSGCVRCRHIVRWVKPRVKACILAAAERLRRLLLTSSKGLFMSVNGGVKGRTTYALPGLPTSLSFFCYVCGLSWHARPTGFNPFLERPRLHPSQSDVQRIYAAFGAAMDWAGSTPAFLALFLIATKHRILASNL